jgi:hypothetical protein
MKHKHTCVHISFLSSSEGPLPLVEQPTLVDDSITTLQTPLACTTSTTIDSLMPNAMPISCDMFGPIVPASPAHNYENTFLSYIIHPNEDILEAMKTTDYPWKTMHHRSFFLPQKYFQPIVDTNIFAVETKDFIRPRHIDWLKNSIPTHDAFEEGNMANISLTIKVEISIKLGIIELSHPRCHVLH